MHTSPRIAKSDLFSPARPLSRPSSLVLSSSCAPAGRCYSPASPSLPSIASASLSPSSRSSRPPCRPLPSHLGYPLALSRYPSLASLSLIPDFPSSDLNLNALLSSVATTTAESSNCKLLLASSTSRNKIFSRLLLLLLHPVISFKNIQRRNVRVFCEAETDYSLTIRDGSVVLTRRNPHDGFQHWIKDEAYSTKVKDREGFSSFALVNKPTGQALQHSIVASQPVGLKPYCPDEFDESILWTKSKDLGHGFRAIHMVNNICLNLDAFNGDKNHGGVHDGTVAVLWEWNKGDDQRWKLLPYCQQ